MSKPLSNPRAAILMAVACFVVPIGCERPSEVDSTEMPAVASPEPATTPTVSTTVDGTEAEVENSELTPNAADTDVAGAEVPAENDRPSPDDVAEPAASAATSPERPALKVRPRTRVRAGGILDLTFDDVEFEIEKDADFERSILGEEIEALHGKEVIIRGFILESYQLKNIKEFVLVRDNQECCFGPGAYIYHNMQVEMVGDARAEYSIRPITVRGKFTIKPWIGPDGKCYSVYHIAATSFKK